GHAHYRRLTRVLAGTAGVCAVRRPVRADVDTRADDPGSDAAWARAAADPCLRSPARPTRPRGAGRASALCETADASLPDCRRAHAGVTELRHLHAGHAHAPRDVGWSRRR